MSENRKLVVKVDTGSKEEFDFEDIDMDFDEALNSMEDTDVTTKLRVKIDVDGDVTEDLPGETPEETTNLQVTFDVTDPIAHLSNDIDVRLKIRKTFDDNIMILDHENIDIIIKPVDHKIVTFPKDSYDDISYRTQERFFEYLTRKGAIDREDIEGGNVYGSLQCAYVDVSNPNQSTVQMLIFLIWKWMEKEKPNFKFNKEMSKAYIDRLTDIENIEGDDPENIAKKNKTSDSQRMDGTYGGVYDYGQYALGGMFYYEE